ncbi:aromatic compound dioxygenase [Amylostereum chailletii]|nr:aromatic compound dioxygenase [Amylostereum chailletii]
MEGHERSNGISAPDFALPYPDKPEIISENMLKLVQLTPNPRIRFLLHNLVEMLHEYVRKTSLTTEEWMSTIEFLTRTGHTCTPLRQEFILLSDVMGVSALVDAINNPQVGQSTSSSVLGPFFTTDAPDVAHGDSIASEGKGDYMYVEGRVLSSDGKPIPDAVVETWETDGHGLYDNEYAQRDAPDCRGRVRTNANGEYGYRAVVPVAYPIPGDGPVGDILLLMGRHNMRPNHLHMMVEAPGHKKLTTALYPEGDSWLASDAVFGVKQSLVVKLGEVDDHAEAKKRGFPKGGKFKLLQFDLILPTVEESRAVMEKNAIEYAKKAKVVA